MASNKQRNQSLEGEVAVPNLPQEVIQEILLRLPVKSLCRFRCISKSWLSRISSPQFAKAHLDIALRSNILYSQRQRLIFSSGNLYSVEYESICNTNGRDIAVVTLDYPLKEKANGRDDVLDDSRGNDLVYYKVSEDEDENPVIVKVDAKFSSKVTKLDDIWVEIFGSCNGLVCIAPEEDTLFLFNPSTGESKRIPEQSLSRSAPYGYNSYGFGYDPTTDDYKGYFFMELFIGWREIGKVKMTSYEAPGRAVAVKLDYPLKCDFYDEVKFIGSCNGLLCVASEPGILLLINPCTREAAEIPRVCLCLLTESQ
ncbi:F-box/kelch-repeat protein At3g06240 isoform X4 [Jatropha curcas]|uniref:F-box/kelch-repeat protein At3g06240 isoform X4 n=1 Tax=Jatropha curcas TaxID=180498 RepID=UPI0005FBE61E|nr:F-box/kelch-repeat protein At3g06240 isoform X4 [Jatropha curcas]